MPEISLLGDKGLKNSLLDTNMPADYFSSNPTGAIGSGSGTPWGMIAEIAATNLKGLISGLNPDITDSKTIASNQSSTFGSTGGIQYK
jgi:hypothetical protein